MKHILLAAVLLLSACSDYRTIDPSTGETRTSTVIQNLPCLFVCVSTISAAVSDTDGGGSTTVSQSANSTPTVSASNNN